LLLALLLAVAVAGCVFCAAGLEILAAAGEVEAEARCQKPVAASRRDPAWWRPVALSCYRLALALLAAWHLVLLALVLAAAFCVAVCLVSSLFCALVFCAAAGLETLAAGEVES
jgi:hypothetical protein